MSRSAKRRRGTGNTQREVAGCGFYRSASIRAWPGSDWRLGQRRTALTLVRERNACPSRPWSGPVLAVAQRRPGVRLSCHAEPSRKPAPATTPSTFSMHREFFCLLLWGCLDFVVVVINLIATSIKKLLVSAFSRVLF